MEIRIGTSGQNSQGQIVQFSHAGKVTASKAALRLQKAHIKSLGL